MTLCARACASRRVRLLFTEERESARCIKPVLRLTRSRLSLTARNNTTHAVVVSPIPFPLRYPYSSTKVTNAAALPPPPHPAPAPASPQEKLYSPLEKWPPIPWNAIRGPRLESVHLPRLVKSSRRTRRIYERGDQKREREIERERERDVRGLERAQATGNNSTAALAPQR